MIDLLDLNSRAIIAASLALIALVLVYSLFLRDKMEGKRNKGR